MKSSVEHEMPPPSDGALVGMTGSIERLSRLALVLRAPLKPPVVERVLEYSQRMKSDGFEGVIIELLNWRYNQPFAKFQMAESLRVQLASSIVYRRARLIHELSNITDVDCGKIDEAGPGSETTFGEFRDHQDDALLGMSERALEKLETQQVVAQPPRLQVQISTTDTSSTSLQQETRNTLVAEQSGHNSDPDASSSNFNSHNPSRASGYPPAPAVPLGHSAAKCTICGKLQRAEILTDTNRWR